MRFLRSITVILGGIVIGLHSNNIPKRVGRLVYAPRIGRPKDRINSMSSKFPKQKIGWDHPFIQITKCAPEYLVKEVLEYSDETFDKWCRKRPHMCERYHYVWWVSLAELEREISTPGVKEE